MKRFVINAFFLLVISPLYAMIVVSYLYRYYVVYLMPKTNVEPYGWIDRLDRFIYKLNQSL